MFCSKFMLLFLYFAGTLAHVFAMDIPIITRDTYDLIQFPKCDGKSPENFVCALRSERIGDKRTCQCRCESGFVTYRDPIIEFIGTDNVYKSKPGSRGCVFYALYREGCHFLQRVEEISHNNNSFPTPTILDLTSSGSVKLVRQDRFQDNGRLCVQPYVRVPGEDLWKRVTDIDFELKLSEINTYSLSWTVNKDADIYAYQGLVMKLNFSECFISGVEINCIMTKIAGTFTGGITCRQRTVNGRCCIFPFVHNDVVYNQCATTSDMSNGPWCAVSLDKSVQSGNHKWREYCESYSMKSSPTPTQPTKFPMPEKTNSFAHPSISFTAENKTTTITRSNENCSDSNIVEKVVFPLLAISLFANIILGLAVIFWWKKLHRNQKENLHTTEMQSVDNHGWLNPRDEVASKYDDVVRKEVHRPNDTNSFSSVENHSKKPTSDHYENSSNYEPLRRNQDAQNDQNSYQSLTRS